MAKERFQAVKGEDGLLYTPNGRRVYPFSCPACGHEAVAAKSMAMECGMNAGGGSCAQCGQHLNLEMSPDLDGDTMIATKWEDYLARSDGENNG